MRATKIFIQLTVYYLIIFGGAWLVIHNNPEMQSYLPVGGAQELINSGSSKSSTLEAAAQAAQVKNLGQSLGWLSIAIIGALTNATDVKLSVAAGRRSPRRAPR